MKRDMDLARDILFAIEQNEDVPLGWIDLNIPGRSSEEVAYHVLILAEAGLIEAHPLSTHSGFDYRPKRLTWQGHEFLDTARSNTLWERAKKETLKQTGGLSLDLLKAALLHFGKQALYISTSTFLP